MPHTGRILRLTSNSCRDQFPENTGWNFKNRIDRFYVFGSSSQSRSREVEVALTDIFVPSQYRNVTETEGWFDLHVRNAQSGQVRLTHHNSLPACFYADPAHAAQAVSGMIATMTKTRDTRRKAPVQIVYDANTHHGLIKFHHDGAVGIRLGQDLARLWGFRPGVVYSAPADHAKLSVVTSEYTGSVHSNRSSLFISCSGIEDTMLADHYVQVIQVGSVV
jgi:hypothetical protein